MKSDLIHYFKAKFDFFPSFRNLVSIANFARYDASQILGAEICPIKRWSL